jgi:zinc transport system ATP-binding protein
VKRAEESTVGYVGPRHVGEEMLCVEHLSFRYSDGTEALHDVSLHVQAGTTLAIVGPNGAGKTSLLKVVLGLLEGYSGSVKIAGLSPHQARRRGDVVSWVPQRARVFWDFPVTVAQAVRMGLVGKTGMFARHGREDLRYVESLMEMLDIRGIADKAIGEVSGGQQQRALIARALAPRPEMLMLDEPTVGVDQAGQQAFGALMKQIRQELGITLVIVSHDLRTILPECQRVACLNRTLHFHDSPARLTPELLGEVFRCDLTGLYSARAMGADDARPDRGDDAGGHDHGGPNP